MPTISVAPKGGSFRMSHKAIELLKVDKDSTIVFAQDSQKEDKWYLAMNTENGFPFKEMTNASGTNYLFKNSTLARKLGECYQVEGKFKLVVGSTSVKLGDHELWPVEIVRA